MKTFLGSPGPYLWLFKEIMEGRERGPRKGKYWLYVLPVPKTYRRPLKGELGGTRDKELDHSHGILEDASSMVGNQDEQELQSKAQPEGKTKLEGTTPPDSDAAQEESNMALLYLDSVNLT